MIIPKGIKQALKTVSSLFFIVTEKRISFEITEDKKKGYVKFTIFENDKHKASLSISAKELKQVIEGMNLYLIKAFAGKTLLGK